MSSVHDIMDGWVEEPYVHSPPMAKSLQDILRERATGPPRLDPSRSAWCPSHKKVLGQSYNYEADRYECWHCADERYREQAR